MSFKFDLQVARFGVSPGDTRATTPVSLCLREGLDANEFGKVLGVQVELHFRHEGPPPHAIEPSYVERYHQYLATLPKVTHRRKLGQIEVKWAMTISQSSFLDCDPSPKAFEQIAAEVVLAVEAIAKKRVPGFRSAELITRVREVLAAMPRDPSEFSAMVSKLEAKSYARFAAECEDPFGDIDWSKYHASARTMLDDPFYWSPVEEDGPVGNDTGADILEDYRAWRKRRGFEASAVKRVERILTGWNMLESGDDEARLIRDQAFIALAFAQIMFEGAIDRDVDDRAVEALERQLVDAAGARRESLELMRRKLDEIRDT